MTQFEDLKVYDKNARKITEKRFEQLKESLQKYGDLSGIVFNVRNGMLVGGNQRYRILRDKKANLTITETYAEPTEERTVALGYITLEDGKKFAYREVDADDEWHKKASVIPNNMGGENDYDMLGNLFSFTELEEMGLEKWQIGGIDLATQAGNFKEVSFTASLDKGTKYCMTCEKCQFVNVFNKKDLTEYEP